MKLNHRAFIITLTALALAASADSYSASWNANHDARFYPADKPIPGRYIVVLEDDQFAPPGLRTAAMHRRNVQETADQIAFEYRGKRGQTYTEALDGFVVSATPARARQMARDPRIAMVAEDAVVEAAEHSIFEQVAPPSWGLDRIDQRSAGLDSMFYWVSPTLPAPVHVYVIDSGILAGHAEFGGRVDPVNGFNAYFDGQGTEDCNGHGTHVAGTIGGYDFGLAKDAILHPVRVLSCSGNGSLSALIAGVDWVTTQVIEQQHPAVANMSLATSPSLVLDNAIRASIAAGVTYVVAAGNSDTRACFFSPARIDEVITVGATGTDDLRAPYSNFGDCVDLYAPGSSITSAFIGANDATLTMSGTSMAAAHVSGIVAGLLAQAPFATPDQVANALLQHAGTISDPLAAAGESALAYSMIDLDNDPELGHGGLDFDAFCKRGNQRCVFTATQKDQRFQVQQYLWNFGDGTEFSHHRPIARHGYRKSGLSGQITVSVAAVLDSGEIWIHEKTVDLPF